MIATINIKTATIEITKSIIWFSTSIPYEPVTERHEFYSQSLLTHSES